MPLPVRIKKETEKLQKDPIPGVIATPDRDNPRYFKAIIDGPKDSPFEGGKFHLELFLPADYPMVPPKVRFTTKVFHPNIDGIGRICLDLLKDNWTPALQIGKILQTIQLLLANPNVEDFLGSTAGDAYQKNRKAAEAKSREWTKLYAK